MSADPCPVIDLDAHRFRKEAERTWALADLANLIDELDQIAIRIRRLESAARSEVERMGHWRKLAQLGELRSRYLAEKRAVEGCR